MCIGLVLVLFVTCLAVRSYSIAQAKLELDYPPSSSFQVLALQVWLPLS